MVVGRHSLRVCTKCGAVNSTAMAKKCPSCGELLGLATEIVDL